MKKLTVILAVLASAYAVWDARAALKPKPSHMMPGLNPEECSGCHSGIGAKGTPLLRGERDMVCFRCHGASGKAQNIERAFARASRHPVFETSFYHSPGEVLPEDYGTIPRHVSCRDCHRVHVSDVERQWRGARGYIPAKMRSAPRGVPPLGLRLRTAESEHELCYLCHSESANLPAGSRSIAAEFDPTNMSYHPVEMPGRNKRMESLIRDLNFNSIIFCTSCHGNSDISGPRGPHGSDFSPLLVDEYRTKDGPESPRAYGLCYMCHDRRSISGNESFYRHWLHVAMKETSCYTCHATHGSSANRNLIDFSAGRVGDRVVAVINGGLSYLDEIPGRPRCFLKCHDATHDISGVTGVGGMHKTWEQIQAQ